MEPNVDATRWNEIRSIFDELVELDTVQRSERLASISASDPELAHQLEALLASDAEMPAGLAHVEQAFGSGAGDNASDVSRDPLGLAGRTISHFRIGHALAAGGMGVVYRAEDTQLHRAIALKFPLPFDFESDTRARFLNEARSAAALDHPNICSIHEVGETADGLLFLAMPLYEGETLKSRLTREGRFEIPVAIGITRQITAGLRAAHRAGIAHRDLKPANVMLLPDGTVKLLDFGLAKVRDVSLTRSGMMVGTVSYMSPEQVLGKPTDERVDLWALGVILYEMVTGRRPFEGEHDISVAHAIVNAKPRPASLIQPGISADTEKLIAALLAKDPAARIASADRLAEDLDATFTSQTRASAAPSRTPDVRHRALRVTPGALIGFGVAAVLLLGLRSVLLRNTARPDNRAVAVLPFTNASGDTADDYISIGLGDAIAQDLSRLRTLIVPSDGPTISHDSVTPRSALAKEMGVTAVILGSVQLSGDRVLVNLELVDSAGSARPWTRRYERTRTQIDEIRREVVDDLVGALRVRVTDEERSRLARPMTSSAEAFDLYLRGRAAELRASVGGSADHHVDAIRVAQSHYSRAREVDPGFAMARARLALAIGHRTLFPRDRVFPEEGAEFSEHDDVRLDQTRLEAETALRLDPTLPEAHEALAWYWGPGKGDYVKAAAELEQAIRMLPNNSAYHVDLAVSYRRHGKWEEAVAALEHAMRVEHHSPTPAATAAMTYSRLRRFEKAVQAWDRAIALAPNVAVFKVIRGHVFVRWHGTVDTLAAALRQVPRTPNTERMITWGLVEVARAQRNWNKVLTILDSTRTVTAGDDMFFRPWSLMRAEARAAIGEHELARAHYDAARVTALDSSRAKPDDARIRIALALALAGLGRKQEAISQARQAMALVPLTQHSPAATATMAAAVQVYVRAGDLDAALELLELLFALPAGREVSVALLRVDPTYDPLRSDRRFEQLLTRFSTP